MFYCHLFWHHCLYLCLVEGGAENMMVMTAMSNLPGVQQLISPSVFIAHRHNRSWMKNAVTLISVPKRGGKWVPISVAVFCQKN